MHKKHEYINACEYRKNVRIQKNREYENVNTEKTCEYKENVNTEKTCKYINMCENRKKAREYRKHMQMQKKRT